MPMPQPGDDPEKPGQKPKPEAPQPEAPQPGEPKPPRPPIELGKKEPEIPPEIQKLIVARTGYANYYFNELNRDRVWSAFGKSGDFAAAGGAWKLTGEMEGGGKVEIALADETSAGTFPQGAVKLEAGQDLDQQLGPAGSGGLLVALHLWRTLLIGGPQKFGDVYYYGTAPYAGIEGQADVLVATRNVAEMNLVFDPKHGQLAIIEMTADPDADPCEVRFSDYRDVGGRQVPHRLDVRQGDTVFGQVLFSQIELGAKP